LEGWDTFAVLAGGAAATLAGLLFVAVSIRVDRIKGSAELRNRAGQTLVLFGVVLVGSMLVAIPGQEFWTLGIELIVLAIATGTALGYLDQRAKSERSNQPFALLINSISPNLVSSVLMAAAGVVLLFGEPAGLYVLVAPFLMALVSGVASAWLFLTRDY
jgi:hypothetical protein